MSNRGSFMVNVAEEVLGRVREMPKELTPEEVKLLEDLRKEREAREAEDLQDPPQSQEELPKQDN